MKNEQGIIMKRGSTIFLRLSIVAIAAGALALCIFAFPSMWVHVDDEYPDIGYAFYGILSGLYVAAVAFFIGLFQALRLLNYVDSNKAFSKLSVRALKRIAICAGFISVVCVAILPFLYVWAEYDDAPGLILMGMILVGASLTVSVFAAVLGRLLREAIKIKSENDLTV